MCISGVLHKKYFSFGIPQPNIMESRNTLSWWYVMLVCHGGMSWWYVMLVCHDCMSWWYVMMLCHDGMSRWYVMIVCHDGMLWLYVMVVCMSWWYAMMVCHDGLSWCVRTFIRPLIIRSRSDAKSKYLGLCKKRRPANRRQDPPARPLTEAPSTRD